MQYTINNNYWEQLEQRVGSKLLALLAEVGNECQQEVRLVGGVVRDLLLGRPTNDLDIVTQGNGIELAQALAHKLGKRASIAVFKNFGTAQVKYRGLEIEFVGARRESYRAESRKPEVEAATFAEDEARRDFTINALSITLNGEQRGVLNDPFGGLQHLQEGIIRTPLEPEATFSDDPLRMMRAVRFASQLGFTIPADIMEAIRQSAHRLMPVVSVERITTEFIKIMESPQPSIGLALMEEGGLMQVYLPEISHLKQAETRDGIGHKDNFVHTLMVVDNVARVSDNLWLRFAALFHDVAKPITKKFVKGFGWTFHNHEYVGYKMIRRLFRRLKLPLDERQRYVAKLVRLHMRPAQLADEGVTDSAVRRLLFEAGDDIDDLMTLCECDLTSKNPRKVERYLRNFAIVRDKLKEIEEKDRIRNFQPPVSGGDIMTIYGIEPRREVGEIKEVIKNAILDGAIPNERPAALQYMYSYVAEHLPQLQVKQQIEE